ncbi:MAG: hypothetical protein ACREUN_01580 [Burkholderiales bacterium]
METLQAFVLLPIGALLYLPFLRLAARWLTLERLSFGTAFLLGLMLGGAGLIASSVAAPFVPDDAMLMAAVLTLPLLAIASAICGYYVVTPEGKSVGIRKGFYLAALSLAMLGGVLAIAGFLMLRFGYRF